MALIPGRPGSGRGRGVKKRASTPPKGAFKAPAKKPKPVKAQSKKPAAPRSTSAARSKSRSSSRAGAAANVNVRVIGATRTRARAKPVKTIPRTTRRPTSPPRARIDISEATLQQLLSGGRKLTLAAQQPRKRKKAAPKKTAPTPAPVVAPTPAPPVLAPPARPLPPVPFTPRLPNYIPTRAESSPEGRSLGWAINTYNHIKSLLRPVSVKGVDRRIAKAEARTQKTTARKTELEIKLARAQSGKAMAETRMWLTRGPFRAYWGMREKRLTKLVGRKETRLTNLATYQGKLSNERAKRLPAFEAKRVQEMQRAQVTFERAISNVGHYVPSLRGRFYTEITKLDHPATLSRLSRYDPLAGPRIFTIQNRLRTIRDGKKAFEFEVVLRQLQQAMAHQQYPQVADALIDLERMLQ